MISEVRRKPVVLYHKVPSAHDIKPGWSAKVWALNHPLFGSGPMVTSEIITICEDGKSFETRNNVYREVSDEEGDEWDRKHRT